MLLQTIVLTGEHLVVFDKMLLSLSRLLLLLQILGFADAANVGKYMKPNAGADFRTPW